MPLFNFVIYPLCAKIGLLKRQLQRMSLGMLFAILSFTIATILESQMQAKSLEYNPENRIRIVNLSPCKFNIYNEDKEIFNLNTILADKQKNETIFEVIVSNGESKCSNLTKTKIHIDHTHLPKNLLIYMDEITNKLEHISYSYDIKGQKVGFSEISFLTINLEKFINSDQTKISLSNSIQSYVNNKDFKVNTLTHLNPNKSTSSLEYSKVDYSTYNLIVTNNGSQDINSKILLETCARYTVILFNNKLKQSIDFILLTDIYPNGLHIGLQLLQIFTMAIAEILVSISGLTFSYEEAPASLKSILQALWILTDSLGNVIVVVITEAKFVSNQVHEYLIFISMLVVATVLFFLVAYFYKYVEKDEDKQVNEEKDKEKGIEIEKDNSNEKKEKFI